MRLTCPHCGERDRREFVYGGAALPRPTSGDWGPEWDDYLHNRENPAGASREYWQHASGCSAWLVVERDTVTHAVTSVSEARV